MPELPEVETTRRGIISHLQYQVIQQVIVREPRLRWPVPTYLTTMLPGQSIQTISRRGKYLLFQCQQGHLLIHLGMSGNLRILFDEAPFKKHDHVILVFNAGLSLRYHDPRRFGCILWTSESIEEHPLLANLGVEPLEQQLTGKYLFQLAQKRHIAVKHFIMDNHIVVGVGNIYANEALFLAGVHPARAANTLSIEQYQQLADKIKLVLNEAITMGGTTLRDFTDSAGKPGYFQQWLKVYGRAGQPCTVCHSLIQRKKIGQRTSYYCLHCQI